MLVYLFPFEFLFIDLILQNLKLKYVEQAVAKAIPPSAATEVFISA